MFEGDGVHRAKVQDSGNHGRRWGTGMYYAKVRARLEGQPLRVTAIVSRSMHGGRIDIGGFSDGEIEYEKREI